MRQQGLFERSDLASQFGKTYPAPSAAIVPLTRRLSLYQVENGAWKRTATLRLSSLPFGSVGRWTSRGEFMTANGSAWRNGGSACSLSQILEANAPPKYSLSPKACAGILRRAAKRGKALPPQLLRALEAVALGAPEQATAEAKTP